jgi:hypothetical protein
LLAVVAWRAERFAVPVVALASVSPPTKPVMLPESSGLAWP